MNYKKKKRGIKGRDTLFFFSFLTEFSGDDVAVVVVELLVVAGVAAMAAAARS